MNNSPDRNNIFVFDIETIPDVTSGRRLHELKNLSDKEVADAMFRLRRQASGNSDFLRLHLHKITAISVVLRTNDKLKVWSLGESGSTEKELIERFFDGVQKYKPTLVSWNGGGFDLPVLHYRALLNGVQAPRYWETGDSDQNYRWNNYLSRYHQRHTDLMDVLSGYQSRAVAPLDEIAIMLGFPGKMGMDGSQVWEYHLKGDLQSIRHYCETDVLNTYLVYLRFQFMRGHLTQAAYDAECGLIRDVLQQENKPHFTDFLNEWKNCSLT
jgi:predicted PolB exonuclease-like 3'-5' exonuclease